MARLGLPVFDRTIHETNNWLQTIDDELGTEDRSVGYHALRAVLFTLRDRIPADLATHFGAQLPLLIRGIFYEGFSPSRTPQTYRTQDEWLQRIEEAYDYPGQARNPEEITRVVFTCLHQHLDRGMVEKVIAALPEGVRTLWQEIPEEVTQAS